MTCEVLRNTVLSRLKSFFKNQYNLHLKKKEEIFMIAWYKIAIPPHPPRSSIRISL